MAGSPWTRLGAYVAGDWWTDQSGMPLLVQWVPTIHAVFQDIDAQQEVVASLALEHDYLVIDDGSDCGRSLGVLPPLMQTYLVERWISGA